MQEKAANLAERIERTEEALQRTRRSWFGQITGLFDRGRVDDELWEELEELLLGADAGVATIQKILDEIVKGEFAKEWVGEFESGMKNFNELYQKDHTSQLETVGRQLRNMMKWIDAKEV